MTEIRSETTLQPDATRSSLSADASCEPQKKDAPGAQIHSSPAPNIPEEARQENAQSVTETVHSSSEPDAKQDAPVKQDWVPLSEATISFAIDTSGSTLGLRLQREQQAILTVSALLNDSARNAAQILPWSAQAGYVTPLSGLSHLSSYGGTDPEVLLNDYSCLAALQNSSCWFLLTDGEIPDISKQRFATALSSMGLHGTACVVIIFGELRGRPTTCNISVGVSVFAAAPDCLFLFMDTKSDICYLLQCKGTFTEILEQYNQQQPLLTDDTTWADLPQISLAELSCVRIPDHRNLQADEIYFESDLIVNLVDLLAGRIADKKIIDAVLSNPGHMRTMTMTAQTRGMAEELRQWVIKQELDPSELLALDIPKVEETAATSMASLMQRMNTQRSLPHDDQVISKLQAELRASNRSYSSALNTRWAAAESSSSDRHESVSSIIHRSYSDTREARDLSITARPPVLLSRPSQRKVSSSAMTIPENSMKKFEGICPVCAAENTTMALLLRDLPQTHMTQDFPATGSKSRLAFPLAMGNFRETDIICTAMYCDDCANNIVQTGTKVGQDKAVCSLTLVSYSGNEKAYNRLLEKAFQHRFDENDAPLVFIAVLCTTLWRLETKSKKEEPLRDALRWACRDLVQSVQNPDTLTWSLSKIGSPPVLMPLHEVLTRSSDEAVRSVSASYFQYPIEGFVVMTKLVNELASTRPHLRNIAKKAVFQRLLFHITEQFDTKFVPQGRVLVHLAMTRLLILEPGRRDKTPTRQLSSFRGLTGLTRNLFGERKLIRDRLSLSFEELVAASLLDREFLAAFKKLGPLADSLESQSGHAMAIFVHYLYRYKTESRTSSDAHYLDIAKTPALASVLFEPSEISAGKAERLIAKLPPWDIIGDATDDP